MTKEERAEQLFRLGYNCAQSVAGAFCEEIGLSLEQSVKAVSAFGGGFGRLREVCGAVSGMMFILSCVEGYSDPTDKEAKRELYVKVQALANKFSAINGALVCRELLGLATKEKSDPTPAERTAEYYRTRRCDECVMSAAKILDEYLTTGELPEGKQ